MLRLALFTLFIIALLGVIIYSRPVEVQVRDYCTDALALRGLNVEGTTATIEYFEGFWTLRGTAIFTRWSCKVRGAWWGVRVEDVTVYPPGK